MAREKVLTLILAGGKGSRLGVLTKERAKPAMPFAGTHRLIDFALSNCMHSRLTDVWVIEQHELHSLNEHLSNGRPWDLDRTYGGLQVLPPYTSGIEDDKDDDDAQPEGGFAEGNADAIYRHRRLIRDFAPDVLLVLSADHVYKLDFNDVISEHLRRKAEVTIVTKEIPVEEAARFGTVFVGEDGRVTDFEYKPERPRSGIVTTEVFVYDAAVLLDTLDELAGRDNSDDAPLKDFGHELLPHLVERGRAYAHSFGGYWRDLGTIETYWQAHMDLLADVPELDLHDRTWTIHTFNPQQLPARIHQTARIDNSLISPGCDVRGHVERSVLAPGVRVAEGARVSDSVILKDCVIDADAQIDFAIIDSGAQIDRAARIGSPRASNAGGKIRDEEIALVGQAARINANARVEPGAQIVPREEA